MSKPTQTNLQLQLDLVELVQNKGLPMWESELAITALGKQPNSEYTIENYRTQLYHYNLYQGTYINKAIDLNNNCFGEWLDKVFPKEVDPFTWKSYYAEDDCEVIATTAEYFKVIIGCSGLTDSILKEIIQEIKLK